MTKKSSPPRKVTQTMVRISDATIVRLNDAAEERSVHRNIILEKAIDFYLDRLPSVDSILAAAEKPQYTSFRGTE